MRSSSWTLCAIPLATLVAATASEAQHAHDAGAAEQAVVIEVDMRDHAFSPTPLRIPAGQPVTLVFTNTGSVEHEFMAGRSPAVGDFAVDLFEGVAVETGVPGMMDDHGAATHGDHADAAGAAGHDHAPAAPTAADHDHADAAAHDHDGGGHGTMVAVEAGARTTMTFTLPAERRGEWEMACFLPRHYERGMHGALVVY